MMLLNAQLSSELNINISESQEQNAKEGKDVPEKVFTFSEAVYSIAQYNLDFNSFLIDELILNEDLESQIQLSDQFISGLSKNTKILFRLIISPNAP